MAVIKNFNPNEIYISSRLGKRFESISESPLTIVEAPIGFGKTMAMREYLARSGYRSTWINVENTDKDLFFSDFCDRIYSLSESAAHNLKAVGFPIDKFASSKIAAALSDIKFRDKYILVIDNYQLIADEFIDLVLIDLNNKKSNLIVIAITQAIASDTILDFVLRKKINYLGKDEFELNGQEIEEYYKKCGLKLEEDESNMLLQYTEGWISALYLQLLSYEDAKRFEPTASIDSLVSKTIWDKLTRVQQDFLISMSVFDSFTIRQAMNIFESTLLEEDITDILSSSGFIRYDSKERKYYIHSILKYFLDEEFEKIEPVFKNEIYKHAGMWYDANEKYYTAITYFYRIKDYESIMKMDYTCSDLIDNLGKNNKEMFMSIAMKTPEKVKIKYTKTYLIFVFLMFVYNEKDCFKVECEHVEHLIRDNEELNERETDLLLGELELVKALLSYNDIKLMGESYKKSFELMRTPSRIFTGIGSWTFLCPSVLAVFHRTSGGLKDELETLDDIMPYYYRITDGNGKGGEALLRAEMLLNQGLYPDAEMLANKAIYMAESREQTSVYLSAMLILARIAFIKADYETITKSVEGMKRKIDETKRYDLNSMLDMCIGYLNGIMGNVDLIPGWLKDHNTIESYTKITNLGYANLIYGMYLLLSEEYSKLISISGQFLAIANANDNILYKIYTYIFIAIAKINTRTNEKTVSMICEAIELAKKDRLYLPFIENYNEIACILEKAEINLEYKEFVKNVKSLAKTYVKGLKSVQKASKSEQSYGLTNRELEVAKLAANRMTNKEIADALFIAESTVKSNLKIIFNKLEINSRNDLRDFFQ